MLRPGQRVLPDLGNLDALDEVIGTGGETARGLRGIFAGGFRVFIGAVRFPAEGLNVLAFHGHGHFKNFGQVGARPVARLLSHGRLPAADQVLPAGILFRGAVDPVRDGGTGGAAARRDQGYSQCRHEQDFHRDLLEGVTVVGIQWGESQVFAPRRMTILAYSCVLTIWPSSPSKSTLTV